MNIQLSKDIKAVIKKQKWGNGILVDIVFKKRKWKIFWETIYDHEYSISVYSHSNPNIDGYFPDPVHFGDTIMGVHGYVCNPENFNLTEIVNSFYEKVLVDLDNEEIARRLVNSQII